MFMLAFVHLPTHPSLDLPVHPLNDPRTHALFSMYLSPELHTYSPE